MKTYVVLLFNKSNNNIEQMKDVGDVDRTHNTKIE
jgi:hypothetical protein